MRGFQFHHIANRLLCWILGVCLLIFIAFAVLLYQQASTLIRFQAHSRAELAVDNTVQRIESLLSYVSRSVRTARSTLLTTQADEEQMLDLLRSLVADKTAIHGMALALEADVLPGQTRFAPYVYRQGQQLLSVDLARGDEDYRQQPWYRRAKEQRRSLWSEPYYDHGGGNVAMVTYSAPITLAASGDDGAVLGVITADISLETLSDMMADVRLGSRGYGYILSATGHIITHDQSELRLASIEQLPLWTRNDAGWRAVIAAMMQQRRGSALLPCAEDALEQCWLSYEPIQGSSWSILVVIPLADIEAELLSLGHRMAGLAVSALLLLALLILWLSRRLSRPINTLAAHTELIARGDLDSSPPWVGLQDEIGTLATNIATMQAELKQHIAARSEASARRQRLDSELSIAASIQAQMLPDGGRSQLQHQSCELAAVMQAARQIGGDFYLYQILGPQQLFFFIGDVSDKGIPAALFMAQCTAHIRELLTGDTAPSELLRRLHHRQHCTKLTSLRT